ncbi:putative short chain dehydrogenase reductase [Cladorrhinum sp. PSN332]|nr:putative short chain dehydrogenase reductase [Cladorrhinum sp. PSN332]
MFPPSAQTKLPHTKKWHTSPYPFISPLRPALSAAGLNVVITGGGTGIGLAIATSFAQANASSVTIIGRRLEKLTSAVAHITSALSSTSSTTRIIPLRADLSSESQTSAAFDQLKSELGIDAKLDILVANAAPIPEIGPLLSLDTSTLSKAFEGFVGGPLNSIKSFLSLASENPVILSTNTCFTHWPAVPNFGVYSICRAALLKTVSTIQVENPHVRVVSVQPGWVATEANGYQENATDTADLPGHFYVWLASQEAAFLNGKFVWANWDAEELLERAEEIKNSSLLTMALDGLVDQSHP